MKAYLKPDGEIVFTENLYDCYQLVEDRDFSQDELKYPKFVSGKIGIDIIKRDSDLSGIAAVRRQQLKNELKGKIDSEVNSVLDRYPETIKMSFQTKADEAEKLLDGVLTRTQAILIYAEAVDIYGQNPTDAQIDSIRDRILVNSQAYRALLGKASARLTKYLGIIDDPVTDILNYKLPDQLLNG